MIYTRHGEPVTIEAEAEGGTAVRIRSIDDPTWVRIYELADLKADGGWEEISDAVNRA